MRSTLRQVMIAVAVVAAGLGGVLWARRMGRLGEQYRARAELFASAGERSLRYAAACKAAHEAFLRLADQADGETSRRFARGAEEFAHRASLCRWMADESALSKRTYERAARHFLRPDPGLLDPPAEDLALRDELRKAEPILRGLHDQDVARLIRGAGQAVAIPGHPPRTK